MVDHDTGKLVWAHPGRDRKTTETFLDLLGQERCQKIKLVSCDDADWITRPVSDRCPNAIVCLDPFHIVKAATDPLDKIRREVWNEARRQGQTQLARELKGARFALWKNPENLTERQQLKLARVQTLNQRLYRAYLLSQQLRQIYRVPADHALALLDAWLKWARRCRLEPFIKVARRITEQRQMVEAAITNKLSNWARSKSLRIWCTCTFSACPQISHRPAKSRSISSRRGAVARIGSRSRRTAFFCRLSGIPPNVATSGLRPMLVADITRRACL